MNLYCINLDICGWFGEFADDSEFSCPVCHALAIPLEKLRTEKDELINQFVFAEADLPGESSQREPEDPMEDSDS